MPGVVVLVTAPHRVLYHEAFGKMDTARAVGMRKDAIFRIASMTKPITSVAVMMLVEQGALHLNAEVSKYLAAFQSPQVLDRVDLAGGTFETRPAARPITIRQLLTHTSGIGYSWLDPSLAMIQKLTGKTSAADLVGSKYSSGSAVISKQATKAFSAEDVPASRKCSRGGEEQGVAFALMVAFRMEMGDELGYGSASPRRSVH